MENNPIEIIKSSGEKAKFSFEKLRASLHKTKADKATIDNIINVVRDELYQGISTKEVYHRAFALLKKKQSHYASRYKLKKAIYELGPTGFPFERFVSALLENSGYRTEVNKILQGHCVSHEIDVIAEKDNETTVVECKFHSEKEFKCNVKIPLYIHSRFQDIKTHWTKNSKNNKLRKGWLVTNTRFTEDALKYGQCCGLYLMSWDYPKNEGLKDLIDTLGLYPITVSTILSNREKQFLLGRNIVLCRDLLDDKFYLDHLGISELRKNKILNEIEHLCTLDNV
mgnify:CR=1 FL=1|tara:strand:- start:59516 stop:60364 length:849 start_codon:yes stop_codon:yes gene_type:complete